MASWLPDRELSEINSETVSDGQNNGQYKPDNESGRESSHAFNDTTGFRRGYSRYPTHSNTFQRRNNNNGHPENEFYHNSRHRQSQNDNWYENRSYDGNGRTYNSTHEGIPNTREANYRPNKFNAYSKRYPQSRGLPVESIDVQECTSVGITDQQLNHAQNNSNQSFLKPTPRWSNSKTNFNRQSNKKTFKNYESRPQEDHERNWRARNVVTKANEHPRDDISSVRGQSKYNRKGERRGPTHNEGGRNFQFQPSLSKVEKSKTDNNFHQNSVNKSEEELQFEGVHETKERKYENQREHLEDQLRSNSYECLVCCSGIGTKVPIWSCSTCFNIFHLSCIKKWAKSSAVEVPQMESMDEEDGDKKLWRCPTCQNTSHKVPQEYLCFCGKQRDPHFSFEAPHSCNEVCGKRRGRYCNHPCNILCHPGPCPPCVSMVTTVCGCGKKSIYVKCNSAFDIKCDEVCNKSLNCGNHTCLEVCHKGSCQQCSVEVEQTCHCGKNSRKVPCGSKESFSSSYCCMEKCDKLMDCKNHSCTMTCHPDECPPCLFKPELISHCACGKSDVETILLQLKEYEISPPIEVAPSASTNKKLKKKKKKNIVEEIKIEEEEESVGEMKWPRTSCLDPLPHCNQLCGKELQCGPKDWSNVVNKHYCKRKCHNGPCRSCGETSRVLCSCRANTIEVPCKELLSKLLQGQTIKCSQRCVAKLSCGRHKCNTNCCTDDKHVCQKLCKRKLSCGLHQCEERCHAGNCDRCWFTSFEELTCRCGAEVVYPPVSCGTKKPHCQRPCSREHLCNHPVRHSCHDDAECPPCAHLTERMCMCGKELRRNIICYLQDVRCGNICGKVLPCGTHFCQRTCHKGQCLDDMNPKCTQPCQFSRPSCSHPCLAPCHVDEPCPKTDCIADVHVTCECGRREAKIPCRENISEVNTIASRFWLSRSLGTDILIANNRLPCDKECLVYKRNKRLAEAFSVKDPNLSTESLVQPNYSEFLKDFAKKNALFVSKIEHDLQQLVKSTKNDNERKCHSFKIMKREQRQVVHELAQCYGIETESQDEEPYRNVVAKATKGKCWLVQSLLVPTSSDAVATAPRSSIWETSATMRPPITPSTTGLPSTTRKESQPTKGKEVDYFDYEG